MSNLVKPYKIIDKLGLTETFILSV